MNTISGLAYIIGALTAIWFGLVAIRVSGNWIGWVIGGGVLGLCISGVCLGMAQAVALPNAQGQMPNFRLTGVAAAAVIIGVTGAIIILVSYSRRKDCL